MHIFFATDGSVSARFAQAQILALPWRPPVHVTVMTATHAPRPAAAPWIPALMTHAASAVALRTAEEGRAAEVVDKARLALEAGGLSVATRTHEGPPGPTIVGMARACRADLVAVGSRGLGAYKGFLLGSVSDYVARFADCSVLLVKTPPGAERRFLFAASEPAHVKAMFRWMRELDLSDGARIHQVTVVRSMEDIPPLDGSEWPAAGEAKPPSWLERYREFPEAAEAADGPATDREPVRVTASVRCGQEVPEILASVRDIRPELLVLGAGRGQSPDGPQLGPVTRRLVGQAPCSVLILRA